MLRQLGEGPQGRFRPDLALEEDKVEGELQMNKLIDFSGQFLSNGVQVPFQVVIQMPEQQLCNGDYLCRVLSQQLFSRVMDVYGVSHNQAVRLAVNLVKEALTTKVLIGEEEAIDPEG